MTRSQRIQMKSLNALTLHSDQSTSFRRTSAVPQLSCKGKPCRSFQPDVVQCRATGDDGAGGLEWACQADLPSGTRFGAVEVSCEGWDGPDDPYILKGSCGLTYNLVRTSPALENDRSSFSPSFSRGNDTHPLVSLLTLALTAYALYTFIFSFLLPRRNAIAGVFRGWGGGWGGGPGFGGGGGGGAPPPPPPYTKHPNQGTEEAWRPGFWSGAAAATAAGYAASMLRGNNQQEQRYRGGAGAGGRFGNMYGGDDVGGGSGSWGRQGGSVASGSGSGGMRSSTGFGGTRNR